VLFRFNVEGEIKISSNECRTDPDYFRAPMQSSLLHSPRHCGSLFALFDEVNSDKA